VIRVDATHSHCRPVCAENDIYLHSEAWPSLYAHIKGIGSKPHCIFSFYYYFSITTRFLFLSLQAQSGILLSSDRQCNIHRTSIFFLPHEHKGYFTRQLFIVFLNFILFFFKACLMHIQLKGLFKPLIIKPFWNIYVMPMWSSITHQ